MEGFFVTDVETIENIKDDEVTTLKDFSFVTGEFIWIFNHPFIFIEDGERSLVVDALALLGGNEYLVQQMIDKMVDTNYRLLFSYLSLNYFL